MLNIYPCSVSLQESSGGLQFEMGNYNLINLNKIEYLGSPIECLFKLKTGERFLSYRGSTYNSLQNLIYFFPELTNSLLIIAKLLNFFISNDNDIVIKNPQKFKDKYNSCYSSDYPCNPYNHLSAYNHYDISSIKSPHIENNKLIYFIERKGIPYQVSCEWPVNSDTPDLKYEILNSID